jgi:hypothetical protein
MYKIFLTLQMCQAFCSKFQIIFTIIWLVTMCRYYETIHFVSAKAC